MSAPTKGEVFTQLMEYLRKAQEATATLSHLEGLNDHKLGAQGWLAVSEMLKLTIHQITLFAQKGRIH